MLRRIGVVFREAIPDESDRPLRLPGDPILEAAAPLPPARTGDGAPQIGGAQAAADAGEAAGAEAQPITMAAAPTLPLPGGESGSDDGDSSVAGAEPARTIGPAAPSAAVRDAAARAAAAMRDQGLLQDILEGAPEALVGPAPPEAVADADASAEGVRSAEVERVLAVLDKHLRAGARCSSASMCGGCALGRAAAKHRELPWHIVFWLTIARDRLTCMRNRMPTAPA